jgi:hypothetical protein
MARKRIIDPEFWSDEEVGHWSFQSRLFYIGLWNFADDSGRFKAHNGLLMSQIFPYDDRKRVKIEKCKDEIGNKVVWYEIDGSQYGFLRNFNKYQRIDRPQESKIPPPPSGKFDECSTNVRQKLPPNIREVNIREVNIREVNIKEQQASPALKAALDKVYKNGTNIYALINKLKKQLKWGPEQQFPDEVLLHVCALHEKGQVKDEWPWFTAAIRKASEQHFALQNVKEGDAWKNQPAAESLKSIMAGIGK